MERISEDGEWDGSVSTRLVLTPNENRWTFRKEKRKSLENFAFDEVF